MQVFLPARVYTRRTRGYVLALLGTVAPLRQARRGALARRLQQSPPCASAAGVRACADAWSCGGQADSGLWCLHARPGSSIFADTKLSAKVGVPTRTREWRSYLIYLDTDHHTLELVTSGGLVAQRQCPASARAWRARMAQDKRSGSGATGRREGQAQKSPSLIVVARARGIR
jgi:hypothetical protein